MKTLQSFLNDEWITGTGGGRVLQDACTGQAVATVHSGGFDAKDVLRTAREIGGPALRKMTFHERALILKELAKYLSARKDALYATSTMAGCTKADSWIDIDGGIGVLFTYSSKGRRELPNAHHLVEGPAEKFAKDGSFGGLHIGVPKEGAAVHINAFNFPMWGMLEKFAPAFLAGVPVITKPATPTAFLAEAVVRQIVESKLLPPGALQLICGSVGDLFDHLDGQDSVGFTGSAATAAKLRGHRSVIERSVKFTAEADSLNSAILAPSSGPGTAEFDLFVREVVREMCAKAGQKCTAIRRAFVPESHVEAVIDALKAKLAKVVVGNPRSETVRMGPLASRDQVHEVRTAIEALTKEASVVVGTEMPALVDAKPDVGAFVAPTLLVAHDGPLSAVHAVEAFGPVCTVVPYRTADDAVGMVKRGEGSLVASVFAKSPEDARTLGLGIAAHHGRVLIVDETCAKTSTGHGSPLPHLVHGGPGRAGGGEELGGIRSVKHHLQRTAIQGSPDMLTALSGEYVAGAERRQEVHPFKRTFDDLQIGDSVTTESRTMTVDDIDRFADLSGDKFYAHMDEEAAKAGGMFTGRVIHGYFVLSMAAGLFVWPEPGPVLANYGLERCRFTTPVYPGDELHVVFTCKSKSLRIGTGYGEVAWDTQVIRNDGEIVAAYDVLTMVASPANAVEAPTV